MQHPLEDMIDRIIRDAERRGVFDDLPGQGKPLADQADPKDALTERMMKEAAVKPAYVTLKEEIAVVKSRLQGLQDETQRRAEMKRLADLELRLALEVERVRTFG